MRINQFHTEVCKVWNSVPGYKTLYSGVKLHTAVQKVILGSKMKLPTCAKNLTPCFVFLWNRHLTSWLSLHTYLCFPLNFVRKVGDIAEACRSAEKSFKNIFFLFDRFSWFPRSSTLDFLQKMFIKINARLHTYKACIYIHGTCRYVPKCT
jgi:hypothetical protein